MADPINVLNPAGSLDGKTLATLEDAQIVTGSLAFERAPSHPFVVEAGSAKVDNLDADKLDGEEGSAYHNASNLDSGTIPGARFPATLPVASAENLTSLPAEELVGTVPDAAFPATLPAASAENLTDLNAAELGGSLPAIDGSALTSLNASALDSGTIPDARFPATLPAASAENLTNVPLSSHASCALTRAGAQTIADNTYTDISFDAENHDSATMHDNSTNPDRITIPSAGVYLIQASIYWAPNATGLRLLGISLNDPAPAAAAAVLAASELAATAGYSNYLTQHVSVVRSLAAGDIVRVVVYQNSGGNLDVGSPATYGPKACWASVTRLA